MWGRLCIFFVSFLAFVPSTSADQIQRWGGFEIIGATLAERHWIHQNLRLENTGNIEQSISKQGPVFCAKLRERFHTGLRCEIVGYHDAAFFVVNFLPYKEGLYRDLRKSSKGKSQEITKSPCVPKCNNAAERNSARQFLLSNAPDTIARSCGTAADQLFDDDHAIRNVAGQFINMNLKQCLFVLDAELLAIRLRQLLYLPYHTDRNKSIATLMELIPYLSTNSAVQVQRDADWLATQSILPNVGGLAERIVTKNN